MEPDRPKPAAPSAGAPTSRYEAEYELETPARCPHCSATITWVGVTRLLRTRVNFTSTLPRRGYVITCPACHTLLPAELRGLT